MKANGESSLGEWFIILDIISKARIFFDKSGFDWSICGGGAIELLLGKKTRTHNDLDLAVYWEDRNSVINFMIKSGWRVFEACGGGKIHELIDSSNMSFEKRNLFCFTTRDTRCHLEPIGDDTYRFTLENKEQIDFSYVEFLFNERDEDYFYYSGNRSIKRDIKKSILKRGGVPFLSPEIVLLYKSTYLNSANGRDQSHDFTVSLPFLKLEQKEWLKEALEIVHANNHEWLQKL